MNAANLWNCRKQSRSFARMWLTINRLTMAIQVKRQIFRIIYFRFSEKGKVCLQFVVLHMNNLFSSNRWTIDKRH